MGVRIRERKRKRKIKGTGMNRMKEWRERRRD